MIPLSVATERIMKTTGVIYHLGLRHGGEIVEELKEYFGKGKIVFELLENE